MSDETGNRGEAGCGEWPVRYLLYPNHAAAKHVANATATQVMKSSWPLSRTCDAVGKQPRPCKKRTYHDTSTSNAPPLLADTK